MSVENEEGTPVDPTVPTTGASGADENTNSSILSDVPVEVESGIQKVETEVEAELRKTKALLAALIVKLNNQAVVLRDHAKKLGQEVDVKLVSFVKEDLSVEKIEAELATPFEALIHKVRGWFTHKPEATEPTPQVPGVGGGVSSDTPPVEQK